MRAAFDNPRRFRIDAYADNSRFCFLVIIIADLPTPRYQERLQNRESHDWY
jgi:hypothetical protein